MKLMRFVGGPLDGRRLFIPVGVEIWQAYDWSSIRATPLGERPSPEDKVEIVNYWRNRNIFVLEKAPHKHPMRK